MDNKLKKQKEEMAPKKKKHPKVRSSEKLIAFLGAFAWGVNQTLLGSKPGNFRFTGSANNLSL